MQTNSVTFESGFFMIHFHNLTGKEDKFQSKASFGFEGIYLNDSQAQPMKQAMNELLIKNQSFFNDLNEIHQLEIKYQNETQFNFKKKLQEYIIENQENLLNKKGITPILKDSNKSYGSAYSKSERNLNYKDKLWFSTKNLFPIKLGYRDELSGEIFEVETDALNISPKKEDEYYKQNEQISKINKIFTDYSICISTFKITFNVSNNPLNEGVIKLRIYPQNLIKVREGTNLFNSHNSENNFLSKNKELSSYLNKKMGELYGF